MLSLRPCVCMADPWPCLKADYFYVPIELRGRGNDSSLLADAVAFVRWACLGQKSASRFMATTIVLHLHLEERKMSSAMIAILLRGVAFLSYQGGVLGIAQGSYGFLSVVDHHLMHCSTAEAAVFASNRKNKSRGCALSTPLNTVGW
jgi:hypothetical protein